MFIRALFLAAVWAALPARGEELEHAANTWVKRSPLARTLPSPCLWNDKGTGC